MPLQRQGKWEELNSQSCLLHVGFHPEALYVTHHLLTITY